MDTQIRTIKPIRTAVKAKAHTAQYKMHKYFARRPYNVFRNLIEHYTKENDIVLDCFCGGGVTIFESLAVKRKVIGVDLNPLAAFITEMQIQKVDIKQLEEFLNEFYENMYNRFGQFYQIDFGDDRGEIEWVEWAYEIQCPDCKSVITLIEENKVRNGVYKCPNPNCSNNTGAKPGVKRTTGNPYSSKPLRIKYQSELDGTIKLRNLNEEEAAEIVRTDYNTYIPADYISPDEQIPQNWDRQLEDCLNLKGIYSFRDLFTKRNYLVNILIFNEILRLRDDKSMDRQLVDLLYFSFSASLRHTNNMTRVTNNWEGGRPTSMDKHAYWLPNVYVETNVFDKLKEKIKGVVKGIKYTNKEIPGTPKKASSFKELNIDANFMILNQSSSQLPLPDKSVHAVITDPPYGSNVQYAELSSFWNVWYQKYRGLDTFIYNEEEAVVNRKANYDWSKDLQHYENILYSVYSECNRVLKNEGYLVFTFNNKNINVWVALLKAIARAGFYLPEGGVLFQDFIDSYKNTAHLQYSGNIHGDFIYSFKKGAPQLDLNLGNLDYQEHIKTVIRQCIDNLYNESNEYTSSELYQEIFSRLINVILQYAIYDMQENENKLVEMEKFSNDFIDNFLKKHLVYENGVWRLGEEV
ncbi:DNA methyltransferase [Bacillus cereus]|uniref:DNA methyltransferase n=1 Tax=Bacillus cereus TaxID=1396 RepID=UPI002B24A7FB|nr:DNA methyltransferase [Bacillus cereus]MEB2584695.1 DNA methyltransferase [Bacillus cereus]